METVFLFWLGFAIVVGVAASGRERSGFGWFLLALMITPLLAGLLLIALPRRQALPDPATHRTCPDCAETVLRAARVCKHCGCNLAQVDAAAAAARPTPPSEPAYTPNAARGRVYLAIIAVAIVMGLLSYLTR